MGGFFGITSTRECLGDVFFGTDYHSHLGTRRGGLAAYDPKVGLQRKIHNIDNAPFRTKFEKVFQEMRGVSAIGCISDTDPQPLLVRSRLGNYAICTIGVINNADKLIRDCLEREGGYFDAMTGGRVNSTQLFSAVMSQKTDFAEGIRYAQEQIEGTASVLILKDDGSLIAARDRVGRLPVRIGKREDGYAVSFESFAYQKLGFEDERELGPGEIVHITPQGITQLVPPGPKKRICSGTPHAIGYANRSNKKFARAFIKYTPTWARSFMPQDQKDRDRVAKMKQIPVHELIQGKDLLFVDDSIVRGTQLKETVEFLYENGARSVHMRSACPPILFGCKYLNFSRATSDMELIARRVILELEGEEGFSHLEEYSDGATERGKNLRRAIADRFHFASLDFQSLEGIVKAIGLDRCELCTYCWNGKE